MGEAEPKARERVFPKYDILTGTADATRERFFEDSTLAGWSSENRVRAQLHRIWFGKLNGLLIKNNQWSRDRYSCDSNLNQNAHELATDASRRAHS